ncbi:hypothetical protein E2C01_016966 [Portunus trituberculatus]|uniref:Uncharacterized protein n=1 Tax=Portunus trituberculatus TaxID=210409 RepID=A0A5B7DS23_PORTR|nr:hypothetical protein [Portunus trituberculatus]
MIVAKAGQRGKQGARLTHSPAAESKVGRELGHFMRSVHDMRQAGNGGCVVVSVVVVVAAVVVVPDVVVVVVVEVAGGGLAALVDSTSPAEVVSKFSAAVETSCGDPDVVSFESESATVSWFPQRTLHLTPLMHSCSVGLKTGTLAGQMNGRATSLPS